MVKAKDEIRLKNQQEVMVFNDEYHAWYHLDRLNALDDIARQVAKVQRGDIISSSAVGYSTGFVEQTETLATNLKNPRPTRHFGVVDTSIFPPTCVICGRPLIPSKWEKILWKHEPLSKNKKEEHY